MQISDENFYGFCCLLYQHLLLFLLNVRCNVNVQVNVSLIHIKSARNTCLKVIFERLQLLSAEDFVHFDCRKKSTAVIKKTYGLIVKDFFLELSLFVFVLLPVIALHPGGISSEHVGPVHSSIQSHWVSPAPLTVQVPPFLQGLL